MNDCVTSAATQSTMPSYQQHQGGLGQQGQYGAQLQYAQQPQMYGQQQYNQHPQTTAYYAHGHGLPIGWCSLLFIYSDLLILILYTATDTDVYIFMRDVEHRNIVNNYNQ